MRPIVLAPLALLVATSAAFAKPQSDIAPAASRANTVARSYALVHRPASLAPEVANPFNPAAFDDEGRTAVPTVTPTQTNAGPSDRELLAAIARRLPIGGTTEFRGKTYVTLGAKRRAAGESFFVPYQGVDVELQVVAITAHDITLRYRGEELVQPIPH